MAGFGSTPFVCFFGKTAPLGIGTRSLLIVSAVVTAGCFQQIAGDGDHSAALT